MGAIYTLECCVDSAESARNAAAGGADRLELCGSLVTGGVTPSPALFQEIRGVTDLRIHVLLRPRFGDFLYNDAEFSQLKREATLFRELGAQGIVIGMLEEDGGLDIPRMGELIAAADGMSVTLHRAFDVCADPFLALHQAEQLGISTILTSGQRNSCREGAPLLQELCERAHGVEIMAGGGVNAAVMGELLRDTALQSFHMSGKTVLQSGMRFRRGGVSMGLPGLSEYEIWRTDRDAVAAARRTLDDWAAGQAGARK